MRAKYNQDVRLVVNNPKVPDIKVKNYYMIDCQNQIIWKGQKGETLLDLEKAIEQLYNLKSKKNRLIKYNATMDKYSDPQPKTVLLVNTLFQKNVSLDDVLTILNNTKLLEKYKQKI
jgi:hypothetical protein